MQIVQKYPFNTPEEFERWLKGLSKGVSKAETGKGPQ